MVGAGLEGMLTRLQRGIGSVLGHQNIARSKLEAGLVYLINY